MKSIINKKLKNISQKTFNSNKVLVENSFKNIRTRNGINLDLDQKMVNLVKLKKLVKKII
jgi:hypothetical protein